MSKPSLSIQVAPGQEIAMGQPKLAYIVSRFPKVTETFVVREMNAIEALGMPLELFPLQKERATLVQPEAERYIQRARFLSLFNGIVLWENLKCALTKPKIYASTLAILIRANWGSRRYLLGAIVFFPLAVANAAVMKRLRISHIHAHFASHPAAVAWAIRRIAGIPYSFVAHGSDLHRDQHMLSEKTEDASFVVAISDYNRDMILDVCGAQFSDKVHVVHCGIDPAQFNTRREATSFERSEGPFRILCVGTLHEVKGQRFLIDACELLLRQGVLVECHFVGSGPDCDQLQRRAVSLGIEMSVVFHGQASSKEVAEQLVVADCLVAPSVASKDGRREGIPVVLMEAMACGVPCVASEISGIPELIETGRNGLLTPPGRADEIAAAITKLTEDPELRKQLAVNGCKRVQDAFDSRTIASQLASLFVRYGISSQLDEPQSSPNTLQKQTSIPEGSL